MHLQQTFAFFDQSFSPTDTSKNGFWFMKCYAIYWLMIIAHRFPYFNYASSLSLLPLANQCGYNSTYFSRHIGSRVQLHRR